MFLVFKMHLDGILLQLVVSNMGLSSRPVEYLTNNKLSVNCAKKEI